MNAQKWFDFVKMTVLAVMVISSSTSSQNNPVFIDLSQTVNNWRTSFFWGTPDTLEIKSFWSQNGYQVFQQQGETYFVNFVHVFKMDWYKDFLVEYPKVPDTLVVDLKILSMFPNIDSVRVGFAFQDFDEYVTNGSKIISQNNDDWQRVSFDLTKWVKLHIANFDRIYLIVIVFTSNLTYTGCSFEARNLKGITGDSVVVYDTHQKPVSIEEEKEANPQGFALYQNYPNPFNPSTKIRFSVPERGFVNLTIFEFSGQRMATLVQEEREAGAHEVDFDASNFPSGVYFYRLTIGDRTITKKMNLIK